MSKRAKPTRSPSTSNRSRSDRRSVTAEKQSQARASRARPSDDESAEQAKDKRADYLTARQLAEVLQVSESTVHRLRRAGRIPAVMLTDRLIRFNLRDVQK